MQALMETLFDIVYLTTVITLGVIMITKSKGNKQYRLFGIMAVVLGLGDSFHLVPRMIALCTTGLDQYTTALWIGNHSIGHADFFLSPVVLCVEDPL